MSLDGAKSSLNLIKKNFLEIRRTIQSKRCKFVSFMLLSGSLLECNVWMSVELFKTISLEIYRPSPSRREEELTISRAQDPKEKRNSCSLVQFGESERESNTFPVKRTLIAWFTLNAIASRAVKEPKRIIPPKKKHSDHHEPISNDRLMI